MDPFKALVRYGWLLDFGESPEQSVERLKGKVTPNMLQCRSGTSHFTLSATEMLKQFGGTVTHEARGRNLDGRAIAGAIAWEYEQNWTGRVSDYLQAPKGGTKNGGVGWGSIHTPEVRKMRPQAGERELLCMRMEAEPAIRLVAEFMDNMAKLYFEESDGVWIRDCPPALAFFFNTGEGATRRSAESRKTGPDRAKGLISLDVSPNEMASWIQVHLNRFGQFKTSPVPPKEFVPVQISSWKKPGK